MGMKWSHHNVVLLTPQNGNPLPPMIIDAFHYFNNNPGVKVETYQQFKEEYPNDVDWSLWDAISGSCFDDEGPF
jgi:hypothetical protein